MADLLAAAPPDDEIGEVATAAGALVVAFVDRGAVASTETAGTGQPADLVGVVDVAAVVAPAEVAAVVDFVERIAAAAALVVIAAAAGVVDTAAAFAALAGPSAEVVAVASAAVEAEPVVQLVEDYFPSQHHCVPVHSPAAVGLLAAVGRPVGPSDPHQVPIPHRHSHFQHSLHHSDPPWKLVKPHSAPEPVVV